MQRLSALVLGITLNLLVVCQNGALAGNRADWMRGKHGIGYRVPAGVAMQSVVYDAAKFRQQIEGTSISWVIVNLSNGAFGSTYMAPHSVLTTLNRGSTPKKVPVTNEVDWWMNYDNKDLPLESYDDRDIMDELITEMDKINVKVIAYLAGQGPSMLKEGQEKAYDYNGASPYVDSCALCPDLTGQPGCACAPSVWKWNNWVKERYGSDDEKTLKLAYAEKIVREYAERYGDRVAGFWFDQGASTNGAAVVEAIRGNSTHPINPEAVIGYNYGGKSPLANHNPGVEDYTSGHMTPLRGMNPQDGCYNYAMILSAENSNDGYVSNVFTGDNISPTGFNYDSQSDPATRPVEWGYANNSYPSLAHVFMPLADKWNSGNIVFGLQQAREWMVRVLRAGGAWTWNVPRCGCAYCSCAGGGQERVDDDDWNFLLEVYKGLDGGSEEVQVYHYDDTNCQCCSPKTSVPSLQWGCLSSNAYPGLAAGGCQANSGLEDIPSLATFVPTVTPGVPCANDPLYAIPLQKPTGIAWKYCDKTEQCPNCGGHGWMSTRTDSRCLETGMIQTSLFSYEPAESNVKAYDACPETCGCCNAEGARPAYCPPVSTPPPPPAPTDVPSSSPSETPKLTTFKSVSSATCEGSLSEVEVNAVCTSIGKFGEGICVLDTSCINYEVINCTSITQQGSQGSRYLQESNKTIVELVADITVNQGDSSSAASGFEENMQDTEVFETYLANDDALATISISEVSTDVLIDMKFDIEFLEEFTQATFGDASAAEELRFRYNISAKGATVSTRNSDCSAEITSLQAQPPTREEGFPIGYYEYLNVAVDVKPDLIANDPGVYTYNETTQKGTITFCLRVDLYVLEDIDYDASVNFHETIVTVTVNMLQGFSVEDISTSRTDADDQVKNTTVDYNLRSWKCDSEWNEDNSSVSQGTSVWICIETTSTAANLKELLSLTFAQEDDGEISGYTNNPISTGVAGIIIQEPKRMMIQTIVVAGFFNIGNNNPVNVNGTILWELSSERRLVSSGEEGSLTTRTYSSDNEYKGPRKLQEQGSSGEFRLALELETYNTANAGTSPGTTPVLDQKNKIQNSGMVFSGIAVGLAMIFVVAALVAYRLAKRIHEHQLQSQEKDGITKNSFSSAADSSSSNRLYEEESSKENETQKLRIV